MIDAEFINAKKRLIQGARKILAEPDAVRKAELTVSLAALWKSNHINLGIDDAETEPELEQLETPARDYSQVKLVNPGAAPKRGKGGTLASRQAILHSLVHIESWAIDLAWDVISRFGNCDDYNLPVDFYSDFVEVANDECRHFLLLKKRLEEIGSHYGAFSVHDGLWESAAATSHSLAARLAVESCVHEARGLDVLPSTITRFRSNGDATTAALLEETVYPEEVSHCAAGVRWLTYLHADALRRREEQTTLPAWAEEAVQHARVEEWFHYLIRKHFYGSLKPPFNDAARAKAGFGPDWYMPLAAVAPKEEP